MEPRIYKPGVYKTPGVYKGAGGIYNGLGVYNDGAGGGSPLPPGYIAYDYIKLNIDPGVNPSRNYWFPLNDCVDNENVEFIIDYYTLLNTDGGSDILTTKNNPGGILPGNGIVMRLFRQYGEWGGFQSLSNTNWVGFPFCDAAHHSLVAARNILALKNGDIRQNDNLIYSNSGIFSKVGLLSKYISVINCGETDLRTKIYRFTIQKNDVILYDYIPCSNDNGVIGFYDLVNNVFIRNTEHNENTYYVAGNDS